MKNMNNQVLWCRSVRSEAVMRMYRPMDDEALEGLNAGISLGTNNLGNNDDGDFGCIQERERERDVLYI
jgi:hypothetical protein